MTVLEALSALWTITTALYSVINKVKGNTEEYKGTLDLVHLFLEDVLLSDIQSVSPAMQERIGKLLRTFVAIETDMKLLDERSLISRTIFHEDVASKLRWVRREVHDAREALLFRVQLEKNGYDLRCRTYSSGQACAPLAPHRTHDEPSRGYGEAIPSTAQPPPLVRDAPSRHSDQLVQRTPARRDHAKRVRGMWEKDRTASEDGSQVDTQRRLQREYPSHSGRSKGRPRSVVTTLPNSGHLSTTSRTQTRRPMSASYGECSPVAPSECNVSWREPCTTLLDFTDNELSEGFGLPKNPQGANALRKHLKLLADNDSTMEQCLLRAWYAVDHRRKNLRVTGVQALR